MKKFDALVLSGGGTKGLGQLGVLHYYYEKGLFDPKYIIDYAGTSVGSIINLLLISGYAPIEILAEIYEIENFFGADTENSIWKLIKNTGLLPIDPIIKIVENLVKSKFGFIPTLQQLKILTNKRMLAPAINITRKKLIYFTPETHPDILVTEVCKLSSKLPLIFQQVQYKNEFYEDGGLADNFPIRIIEKERNILGVIVTGSDFANATSLPFINYIYRLIMFPIDTNTFLRCPENSDNFKKIYINFTGDASLVISISLTTSKKMEMFMSGYKEAEREEKKEKLIINNWHWNINDGWDVSICEWE